MIRALCLAAVLVLAPAAPAAAHTVTAGADLRIAQTIAGAELTVVVKGTTRVPGPLRIGVIAYQPVSGLPVKLEAARSRTAVRWPAPPWRRRTRSTSSSGWSEPGRTSLS
ncbi:hypothetical protein [Nonomuraea diastatica]|uniref:Uncharacterized protein n=1 Tax=Nonomuraea diastatica TaxID=1848329 RepID=A0A4R4WQG2_9ACTN|nr:hypothetical protein [Nonomuraea diastatica]TDD19683.1 hypothetical protein E1294_20035 [Nonomuraea diastatica]